MSLSRGSRVFLLLFFFFFFFFFFFSKVCSSVFLRCVCFIYCEIIKPWSRAVRRTYTLTVSCGLREGGKGRAVRCVPR